MNGHTDGRQKKNDGLNKWPSIFFSCKLGTAQTSCEHSTNITSLFEIDIVNVCTLCS